MARDDTIVVTGDLIQRGRACLARGAWTEARRAFEEALTHEEGPEALEGLGAAASSLDDARATFDARLRSYRLYLKRNETRGAARVAIALAKDYFTFRGDRAIANGWLQRAQRLLVGDEDSVELGWLAVCRSHMAVYDFDATAALRYAAEALSVARACGDINLEMLALAYQGFAGVLEGSVQEGMRCLDESAAAIIAGEMTDADAACTACCCFIFTCEQLRDFERAAQWCARLEELAIDWSSRMMHAVCRTYYAALLIGQGSWDEAEAELTTAVRALEATRPAMAADGIVRLATLYALQGRYEEAAELFDLAESPPHRALAGHLYLIGRAFMALEQDRPRAAADLAERFLRAIPGDARIMRGPALEVLVQAWSRLGDHERARKGLMEFRRQFGAIESESMRGSLCFAEGTLAEAEGDYESAKRCFEDALDFWGRSGAIVDMTRARIELSRVLAALGRAEDARREAAAALEAAESFGAAGLARRAEALLQHAQRASRGRGAASVESDSSTLTDSTPLTQPELTERQLEVLRLVAQGLTNKQIAARLVLSDHTIHRHLANIYGRLGVASRTAAAAYAVREELI